MESPELMKAFLLWLGGGDPSAGARKYEEIRRNLILFFRWRGCYVPEELTDEVIDRTARAVLKPDFHYEGDRIWYFRGVASNLFQEWLRKTRRFPTDSISDNDIDLPAPAPPNGSDSLRQSCLERCLNSLHPAKRNLIIRYYRSDKRAKIDERRRLAEEHGVGMNALRIQVFRIRDGLHPCVADCEAKGEIL